MNFSHKALGLTLTALLLVPFFSQVGAAQTPKKAAPSAVKVGTAKKDPSMTLDFTKEDAAKKIILSAETLNDYFKTHTDQNLTYRVKGKVVSFLLSADLDVTGKIHMEPYSVSHSVGTVRTEGLGGKAAASVPIEIYTEETQDAYVTYAKEKNLWVKETVPKEADAAPLDMAAVKDLMTRSIRSAHVLSQDGGKEVILFRMDALEPLWGKAASKGILKYIGGSEDPLPDKYQKRFLDALAQQNYLVTIDEKTHLPLSYDADLTELVRTTVLIQKEAEEAKAAAMEAGIDIEAKPEITYDDFAKLQFQVGEIIACEAVKKSKKLLCSQVKIGSQVRQIVSGIKAHYTPEEMVGKKVMVVTNLKPAKLAGIMSEGMLLCAEDADGNLSLMVPEKEMPSGAEIC